jgi:hypothetical protein
MKGTVVIILTVLILTGCRKEYNREEDNENELITTIVLSSTETGSSDTVDHVWEDVDGPGGADPDIDTIKLEHGKNYDISLSLFDKTKIPFENITTEIEEESNVHRFYLQPDGGTGITISDPDKDIDGLTLGLLNKLNTSQPATGNISITLRHYPDGGKAEEDASNSPKSTTDAEAIFPVVVK